MNMDSLGIGSNPEARNKNSELGVLLLPRGFVAKASLGFFISYLLAFMSSFVLARLELGTVSMTIFFHKHL